MHAILIFLFKSFIVSAILTGYYWFALRNRKQHIYNRSFLLFILYASVQIPLLNLQWMMPAGRYHKPAAISILQAVSASGEDIANMPAAAKHTIDWLNIAGIACGIISVLLLLIFVVRIISIIRLKRKFPNREIGGITFINTSLPQAPFSFFNNLFWRKDIELDSETGAQIFRHEATHIRQGHSYDKLFSRLLICIFWMNPFYWLIYSELTVIHEFIADEAAVGAGNTEKFALMLLQAQSGDKYFNLTNQFFYSPIKRRLIMLGSTSKNSHAFLRLLLVLPFLALSLFTLSFISPAKHFKATGKFTIVLDAGHGGKDNGAQTGQHNEKDLNLKIVKRLLQLAPDYGITTYVTRNDDSYPTLEQRSQIANNLRPNAFISIHVNEYADNAAGEHDYAVYVARQNAQYDNSKLLGSAIAGQLTTQIASIPNLSVSDKGLIVLKANTMPSVLIECGNIENAMQVSMLTDNDKLDRLCKAILDGVVAYKDR